MRLQIGPADLWAADPEVIERMVDLIGEQDKAAEREQRRARARRARGR